MHALLRLKQRESFAREHENNNHVEEKKLNITAKRSTILRNKLTKRILTTVHNNDKRAEDHF